MIIGRTQFCLQTASPAPVRVVARTLDIDYHLEAMGIGAFESGGYSQVGAGGEPDDSAGRGVVLSFSFGGNLEERVDLGRLRDHRTH